MKTPDEIKKRLEEFREDLFKKDKRAMEAKTPNNHLFEAMITLEGGINALKWALEESDTLLNSGIPYKEVSINLDDEK